MPTTEEEGAETKTAAEAAAPASPRENEEEKLASMVSLDTQAKDLLRAVVAESDLEQLTKGAAYRELAKRLAARPGETRPEEYFASMVRVHRNELNGVFFEAAKTLEEETARVMQEKSNKAQEELFGDIIMPELPPADTDKSKKPKYLRDDDEDDENKGEEDERDKAEAKGSAPDEREDDKEEGKHKHRHHKHHKHHHKASSSSDEKEDDDEKESKEESDDDGDYNEEEDDGDAPKKKRRSRRNKEDGKGKKEKTQGSKRARQSKAKSSEEGGAELSARPKKRKKSSAAREEERRENEQRAEELVERMENAYRVDRESVRQRRPAVAKMQMLEEVERALTRVDMVGACLERGVLRVMAAWLTPTRIGRKQYLPNMELRTRLVKLLGSLDFNVLEHKNDGIGYAVKVLYESPDETRENKLAERMLIQTWSRKLSANEEDELETRETRGVDEYEGGGGAGGGGDDEDSDDLLGEL